MATASYRPGAQLGYFLLIRRDLVLVATVFAVVYAIVLQIPSIFLFKNALTFQSGLLSIQMALAGVLVAQVIGRAWTSLQMTRHTFLVIQNGLDIAAGGFAVAAGLASLGYAINLTLALADCPNRSEESFGFFLNGLTNCTCEVTDFNTLERMKYFYTQFAWFQVCFDDYAITITWTVLAYVAVVFDILVIILEFRVRLETVWMFARRPPAPSTPTPQQQRRAVQANAFARTLTHAEIMREMETAV